MTPKIKKGEVWLANLNPSKGTEPGKTRPVLILQAQALLDISHPSSLIIPLSTNLLKEAYPLRIRIKAQDKLEKDFELLVDQMRAIDNRRLTQGPLTQLSAEQLKMTYQAVCEVIGKY